MSEPSRLQWEACARALRRFGKVERRILEAYFSTSWGRDLRTVETYSKKTGISTDRIWDIIKNANRAACEERGLIDRKEG